MRFCSKVSLHHHCTLWMALTSFSEVLRYVVRCSPPPLITLDDMLGVCGTDQHIHHVSISIRFPNGCSDHLQMHFRGSSSPSFPYVIRLNTCVLAIESSSQLIPGHEAIGSVVKMGRNVKGFAIGDRCVADVGITVSAWHGHPIYSSSCIRSRSYPF
jgi:hypothetical protein